MNDFKKGMVITMELWLVITWAVLTVVLVCVEVATVQFVAIWFAAGSFISFISSLFGASMTMTLVLFIVCSTILLLATRPLVKRFLSKKVVATNADSIIGTIGIVTEKIDNDSGEGRVFINGLSWSARGGQGSTVIEPDTKCIVISIEGVKVIVKPL